MLEAVSMDFGLARSYVGDPDMFRVYLINLSGRMVGEIRTWDPRAFSSYAIQDDGTFVEEFILREDVTASIVIPFVGGIATLEFTDPWQYPYLTVDLKPTIEAFCMAHQADDECDAWLREIGISPSPTP
jgi:hypothetical protein